MKQTTVIVLAALFFPGAVCAQFLPEYDDVRLARMGYTNSGGENGVSIYHYRRDGVMGAGTWLLRDRSRYSANYYIYDEYGRMIEKYREFSDGLVSTQHFEHDAAGRVTRESFERSDGRGGYADFTWSEDGQLLTADCRKFRGWFDGFIRYEYEDGRLASAAITRDNQAFGEIHYVYGADGHLAEETWYLGGGQWSQTFSYEYEPLPLISFSASSPLLMMNPGFWVTGESYDFNARGGGPSFYEYDEDGRLLKKVFERSDGLRTETSYAFDDVGNLVSSHRVYHDGRTADFLYDYDDAMRMSGKTFKQSSGEAGFEKYHYDRLGRLTGATYQNMDFWLNGELAFSYDDWGRLEKGTFNGRDGLNAKLEFTTDENGNVLRLHWAFGNGMTQTYTFEYNDAPGTTPEPQLFLPGIVSTPETREFSGALSPDGREFYFARKVGERKYSIFVTRMSETGWSTPELASFSGDHFNHEPYITHDGSRIYWGTVRRKPNAQEESYAVWTAERKDGEWVNEQPLPFDAMYVTAAANGTLYFTGKGLGGAVISRASKNAEGEWEIADLPEPLLADEWDGHPLIAPDESWLIFDSETRAGNTECGLFISVRGEDGSWGEPQHMVDSIGMGRYAMLSPDGQTLFLSWEGDIFKVSSKILDRYLK